MSSSLSSVVSNLVRASMGSSVNNSVTDDDLDRHVAELILKEAKKKAEAYGQRGIRAYISSNLSDSNAPKTNKRFLSSIIKSTDDHNKTILRAQAQAAQEVKRERDEQERRQRRLRAEEAVEAERLRRSGRTSHSSRRSGHGKRKRDDRDEGWDHWDGRTAERKKVSRDWESWDGRDEDVDDRERPKRRRRSKSRSRSRDREGKERSSRSKRAREDEDDGEGASSRRHRRSRSRSPRPKHARDSSRERDDETHRPKRHRHDREASHRRSRRSRSRSTRRSVSPSNSDDRKVKRRRSRSPKYALDDLSDESSASPAPRSRRRSPSGSDTPVEFYREAELRQRLKESRKAALSPSSPLPGSRESSQVDSKGKSPEAGPSYSSRSLSPMTISRSPTPGPQPQVQLPSKMDRYFEESYDPRLDVAPLTAPQVPATGLVSDADFEGWDAMLELIRIRREDKEEKKRMERLGLLPKEKSKTKKKGVVESSTAAVADRWGADGVSVMDIEYKKRGSVREWDMGKEGF